MNLFPRSSGILLHPTSLPGPYGIGDLGDTAFQFVDCLAQAGQSVWQVLPLGPTSYGDSPYQTLSTFAGNPNLISFDRLVEAGWLTRADVENVPDFPADRVDYGAVIPWHNQLLDVAYQRFIRNQTLAEKTAFENWCARQSHWLDDFALFMALKNANGGRAWVEWPTEEALRDEAVLETRQAELSEAINEHRFRQWLFYQQWQALRTYANSRGVRLVGDIPIFVAHDSSDVWANRANFYLDEAGQPTVIAGVPPDYFSETGQRWGNPLYRWDVMQADGYQWWLERIQATLALVDMVRIDHFRGFESYWEIPASEPTAIHGQWVAGPGFDFFDTIQHELGELPLIAEDLGVITPEVEALRDHYHLPGMKVLQFAWSEPTNPFLPHNHTPNHIVYCGTHDNNTTLGWYQEEVTDTMRGFIQDYTGATLDEITWEMIRVGMMSPAHTFIATIPDLLGLGSPARMNTPGQQVGNWAWRMPADAFHSPAWQQLAHLTWLYQRQPDQNIKVYGDVAVNTPDA